ncbi:cupin domain-containing protein [Nocardioides sp. GCM10030258]|uniref:cupin domain-containing protein n=1 Tax=unclassified Nocardioides TaxID=2615069 RepID=UPI00360C7D8F
MVRRVVTSINSEGRSIIASDGDAVAVPYEHTPLSGHSLIWTTGAPPDPTVDGSQLPASYIPGVGGTVAMTVTFAPNRVYADPNFDFAAAVAESLRNTPGLAEAFEPDAPGMHATPTVDYVVVLDGPVILEVDNQKTVTLETGDVVVQNAARHAWRVPGDDPATILVVLIGAKV